MDYSAKSLKEAILNMDDVSGIDVTPIIRKIYEFMIKTKSLAYRYMGDELMSIAAQEQKTFSAVSDKFILELRKLGYTVSVEQQRGFNCPPIYTIKA